MQTLLTLIKQTPNKSLIVAPEVCLSGFDYARWDEVLAFAPHAVQEIKKVSTNKIIILTIVEKIGDEVFNMVKVFHKGTIVHERAKAKLFRFGFEHEYFAEGETRHVEIIEIEGIKIGILICFELRFKDLWKQLEGADIIAVPSWWGVLRTEHFKTLTQALAILNQCYVIASDSLNEECTKMSGIITPNAEVLRNGNTPCLELEYNKKEIALMRRYMDVGIG
ncbi:carbon-nitrogen hydrolase family protein [bacterium]|nr:carbon-nitrogen hydrolase family protein [bacterium]MBU1989975.1 carbon-nitrogen hydrolase family protein [bacterium]